MYPKMLLTARVLANSVRRLRNACGVLWCIVQCSVTIVCCLLFIVYCLCCLLFVVCCLLFIVYFLLF